MSHFPRQPRSRTRWKHSWPRTLVPRAWSAGTGGKYRQILIVLARDHTHANKRARVISKGSDTGWVYYQTGTALLLSRLLASPTTARCSSPTVPPHCARPGPVPGRWPRQAVLPSQRRTFRPSHRPARPQHRPPGRAGDPAPAAVLRADPRRRSRHQHPDAAARSRHASMRSFERYAQPDPEALTRHAAESQGHVTKGILRARQVFDVEFCRSLAPSGRSTTAALPHRETAAHGHAQNRHSEPNGGSERSVECYSEPNRGRGNDELAIPASAPQYPANPISKATTQLAG